MFTTRRRRRAEPLVVDLGERASLAEGTVVDAAIVARLARLPLLRLEGTVVLTPGRAMPAPELAAAAPLPVEQPIAPALPASDRTNGAAPIGADLPEVARRLARLRRR